MMSEKVTTSKPPLPSRAFGWGAKKLRHPALGEVSRRAVKNASQDAISALKPAALDGEEIAKGFRGRYADGGAARFKEMMEELSIREEDLVTLEQFHRLQRVLNAFSGLLAFGVGLALMVSAEAALTRLGGLASLVFALVFLAGYVRHDFSIWQIAERKMSGFRPYLSVRFGRA